MRPLITESAAVLFVLLGYTRICVAFCPPTLLRTTTKAPISSRRSTSLRMGLDLVTYLRTEFISAALCTNQIPRAADTCLQLGTEDGRAVNFVPRTIRQLKTSSAEKDGKLTVSTRRQLKQQQLRRKAATVEYIDQPADDLFELEDESMDVVISLTAAQRMKENGQDWQRSVQEAARVLKPGGRLLFVEQTELDGVKYLDYVQNLHIRVESPEEEQVDDASEVPVFEDVGSDDIDLVLVPHVAGVAIKSADAGLTPAERQEKALQEEMAVAKQESDRVADFAISALEGGVKRRRKKKKKKKKKGADSDDGEETST